MIHAQKSEKNVLGTFFDSQLNLGFLFWSSNNFFWWGYFVQNEHFIQSPNVLPILMMLLSKRRDGGISAFNKLCILLLAKNVDIQIDRKDLQNWPLYLLIGFSSQAKKWKKRIGFYIKLWKLLLNLYWQSHE